MTRGAAVRPRFDPAQISAGAQFWARVSGTPRVIEIQNLESAGVWRAKSLRNGADIYVTRRDLLRVAKAPPDGRLAAAGERES